MEDFQKSVLHHHRWVNIHWSLTLLVVCKKGRGIKPVSLCSILPYLIVSPFYFYVLTLAKWETWRISPGFGFWSVQAWCQYTYWADPVTHISGSSSHSALLYYNSETVRGQIKRLSNHFCFYWSWNINKPVTKIELKCLLFFFLTDTTLGSLDGESASFACALWSLCTDLGNLGATGDLSWCQKKWPRFVFFWNNKFALTWNFHDKLTISLVEH